MSLTALPASCGACRALLRSFALALMVSAAFAPALAGAAAKSAARPPDSTDAPPPHFPDAAHVANGCHLSTLAFLARFAAEFPGERGQPVVVSMRNADGSTRPHTLAVITWRGELWGRDEFFGVFPLKLRASAEPELPRLIARVEPLLAQHARLHFQRPGTLRPVPAPKQLPAAAALGFVRTAATLLPLPTQLFWIRPHAGEAVPALFFRPAPGVIAVYSPIHGTCLADCKIADDAKVVALVAARLGYQAKSVERETATFPAVMVAATAATPGGLDR